MAIVYDFVAIRNKQIAAVTAEPALECPRCEIECPCVQKTNDGMLTYKCEGNGHRKLVWRIDIEGNMLHGASGNRYYR